jgi:hypothetical protein
MRDTIDMAREAWLDTYGLGKDHISFVEALKRFEALVRADEREACARIAWNREPDENGPIEAAIRARGNT